MGKGDTPVWAGFPRERRVCAGCGEKLTLKDSLWLDSMCGEAWHHACKVRAMRVSSRRWAVWANLPDDVG